MFPIEITVPIVPPSPNVLLRAHWSKRYEHVRDWKEHIYYRLTNENRKEIRALNEEGKILFVRIEQFRIKELDPDNLHGSVKVILDAIVSSNLAFNDSKEKMSYTVEQIFCNPPQKTKIRFDKDEIL